MADFVLGLHIGHDSAASLFRDGQLLFAEEEERHSRHKNHFGSPIGAIDAALQFAHARCEDVVAVGIGWDLELLRNSREEYLLTDAPLEWSRMKIGRVDAIRAAVFDIAARFPRAHLSGFSHHLAHGASTAPFVDGSWTDEVPSLVMDAVGERAAVSLYASVKRPESLLLQWGIRNSVGYFYQRWAELAGFRGAQACGYFMSLAPLGDAARFRQIIRRHCTGVSPEKLLWINPDRFDPTLGYGDGAARSFTSSVVNEIQALGGFDSVEGRADVAAAVQELVEEITMGLCDWLIAKTNCRHITLSGGVFLNCLLVGRLRTERVFDSLAIGPCVKDSGVSVGAGVLAGTFTCGWDQIDVSGSAFLGTAISREDQVWDNVLKAGLATECGSDSTHHVVNDLREGKLVAVANGRLEFGPRALGGRSIIADPSDQTTRNRLNRVKHRELFQPVAGSMSASSARALFGVESAEPFMTTTYFANQTAHDSCPAILHADGGCRVHVVDENCESLLQIVNAMKQPGAVANSSYNDRDEPLPRTSADAVSMFARVNVDVLYGPGVRIELSVEDRVHLMKHTNLQHGTSCK